MKTKIQIVILTLMVLSQTITAKSQCGLYMTQADFLNNKLTNECSCGKKNTIRAHDFFYNGATITLKDADKKRTFKKSEVYGYRNGNGEVYRVYKNAQYLIEEAGNIFIYSQKRNIPRSKGFSVVKTYYFSTMAGGDILALTEGNLKAAYNGNEHFLDLLPQFFGTNGLNEYDNILKTFKLNYVFTKTIKK